MHSWNFYQERATTPSLFGEKPVHSQGSGMIAWVTCLCCDQATAQLYNALGLPEHEAMEAFVEYDAHHPSPLFHAGTAPAPKPTTTVQPQSSAPR